MYFDYIATSEPYLLPAHKNVGSQCLESTQHIYVSLGSYIKFYCDYHKSWKPTLAKLYICRPNEKRNNRNMVNIRI